MSVIDRVEIAGLVSRLGRLLDDKRWEDAHTVFHPEVAIHSPRYGETTGFDEFLEVMRRTEQPDVLTQHSTTGLLIDLDGDRATVSADSTNHFYRAGEAPFRTASLRMDWVVVRTPAGWRVRDTRTTVLWIREE